MNFDLSNHTPDAEPAFRIPLTDKQLIALGRLTAIWSQIDFCLDFALERVFKIDPPTRHTLIGERMVGAKISLLEKGCEALDDGDVKDAALRLAKLARGIKNKRNHAAHGMWGWRTHPVETKTHVCARHPREPGTPLKPGELAALVRKAAECSRAGIDLIDLFTEVPCARPARMFHGRDDAPPTWLGTPRGQRPEGSPAPRRNRVRNGRPPLTLPE